VRRAREMMVCSPTACAVWVSISGVTIKAPLAIPPAPPAPGVVPISAAGLFIAK